MRVNCRHSEKASYLRRYNRCIPLLEAAAVNFLMTSHDTLERVDRARISIELVQRDNRISRLRHVILTPGELFVLMRIFWLLGKESFWLKFVRYNQFLIALGTLTYICAWYYAFKILLALWGLFHSASWNIFFQEILSWQSIQAIFAMVIRYFFGVWAIDSFTTLPEMNAEYNAIRDSRQERRLSSIIRLQTRNELLRVVPSLVQAILSQAFAMSAFQGMDDFSFQRLETQLSSLISNLLQEHIETTAEIDSEEASPPAALLPASIETEK
jgi:hypothetical protein